MKKAKVFVFFTNKPDEDCRVLAIRNIVYISLFHVVCSVFAVLILTLFYFYVALSNLSSHSHGFCWSA